MPDFVHLHVHTEYSLLDGACRINELCRKASGMGMKALAVTDHGTMYGVVDFYEACIANGIKPVIGCEVYTAARSRFDRDPVIDAEYGHLILLAENDTGYHNLIKLVSAGFTEGFYYKPRIDTELLRRYSGGIIACSACLKGDVARLILAGDRDGAKKKALEFRNIFGENNFFLELQSNGLEEQRAVNAGLVRISEETGIPLVATNDVHYIEPSDRDMQDVLTCIQTGKKLSDENRLKFSTDTAYLRSPDEMYGLFKNVPQAIENTVRIAERCNVELRFGRPVLPVFDIPSGYDAESYLRKLCFDGASERYGSVIPGEVSERLGYELSVIAGMNYCEYYLIVWDFIRFARENGIKVGPGRGSGAGSLAAYCLKITDVDPLRFNLAFERFLNPERISMPDFDIDFNDERRKDVIDYVIGKYGADRVAQIVTFGTLGARAAIRDVGRVFDVPYAKVDAAARLIPEGQLHVTIKEAIDGDRELSGLRDSDPEIRRMLDMAMRLEGMPRNCSTHAAGVVLTRDPVTDYVPVHKTGDVVATQFPMGILEKIGLLKIDFLGLRTLTVIQDAEDMIFADHGVRPVDYGNEMNDPAVFGTISKGKTTGVFQLESRGMTKFMTELMPDSIEDIIAGIALYRPGPMDQIPRYIENKKNPGKITYETELLRPILEVTYGCIVYQEQVMQIFRDIAGFSMGASDLVRRAMAKKKHDVMMQEKERFISGATGRGIPGSVATSVFDKMTDFASYAFNKAHAACYAVIAYRTAWLKTYYPAEFMAGMMNSLINFPERLAVYVNECTQLGIKIVPPDVNASSERFTVKNGSIIYALGALKNVGERPMSSLVAERDENGPYRSFHDFIRRTAGTDINKRAVESLIKAGAFDSMGYTRRTLFFGYEDVMDGISSVIRRQAHGQLSLFDGPGQQDNQPEILRELSEFDTAEKLAFEKSILGIYLSGHPLQKYFNYFNRICTLNSSELDGLAQDGQGAGGLTDGGEVTMAGMISGIKKKITKNGSAMAFMTLEDAYGSFEAILFPKTYEKFGLILKEDMIVVVKGRINLRDGEAANIYCSSAAPVDAYAILNDKGDGKSAETDFYTSKERLPAVKAFCDFFSGGPGTAEVRIFVSDADGTAGSEPVIVSNIRFGKEIRDELSGLCAGK